MRAVTLLVAATAVLLPASAFAAVQTTTHHCENGASVDLGVDDIAVAADSCTHSSGSTTSTSTRTTSPRSVVDGPSAGQSAPSERLVSREEWAVLLQDCMRGPNNDNLSPTCTADLPGILPDPTDPAAPPPPAVTVAQVRESAISRITMGAPKIGASPCLADPASCQGTVGVPVWLWVGDGNGQLPSDSATATAGPYSITATAKVSTVKWSLGDGQTTVCSVTGTKYSEAAHGWSAPECGFERGWKKAGTYTLTATYVWDISWSGDQTGSATQTMSSTQQVTVGELQAVVTSTG